MLCLLALIAFTTLAAFSARYRALAREAFACVGRRVTLRPCTTGFDTRVRAVVVGRAMRIHPALARIVHRHVELLAWTFVLLVVASGTYLGHGLYNYQRYGACQGPVRRGFCVFDPSGRHGRYSGIVPRHRGTPVVPGDGGAPAVGRADAPVTIIEFGSYTCPWTRESAPVIDALLARHADDVRFVYRNFPLDAGDTASGACDAGAATPHAGATRAALAADCAHAQGRFQDYHRLLLSRPDAFATCDGLVRAADELGLDVAAFARCLAEPAGHERVWRDVADGERAGLYGTPTFWVNGRRLVAPSSDDLERAVRRAIAEERR